ncbi:hypothetical protein AV530_012048 [Patagioenas fasciata monilis]|uniref:Uncharacterized protein n=1 Tax=Patagioenas fasciata monilis TaxID=372326 RepID=A0A1V4JUR2_PATFA|nr:hypothetical protein AV530_012048 [Patagioenas fasciata monilis]
MLLLLLLLKVSSNERVQVNRSGNMTGRKIIYEALRIKTDPQRCKGGLGPAIRHYIMCCFMSATALKSFRQEIYTSESLDDKQHTNSITTGKIMTT